MKFEKLVKIVTEAGFRPSAPKNMGGNRLYRAKESEGPSGVSSSSVGKSDNFELSTPLNRWEYDPMQNTGKSGFSEESKLWKSMLTSFRLLFNDPYFDRQAQLIIKKFNDSRDSYKNIKGIDDDGKTVKYDEESKLDILENRVKTYTSKLTELRTRLDHHRLIINRTKLSKKEKNDLEKLIGRLESDIKTTSKQMARKTSKLEKEPYKVEISKLAELLHKKTEKLTHANYDESKINREKANFFDVQKKIDKSEKDLQNAAEELESLRTRISEINQNNENAANVAQTAFLDILNSTAHELLDKYNEKIENRVNSSPNTVDWDTKIETLTDAIDRLKALTSNDEDVNPILGYLAKFERDYDDKEFDVSRALDKNVNISVMRDFNKLPFVVLSRIYSSVRASDKNPIDISKLSTTLTDEANDELFNVLKKMSANTADNKSEWTNPNTKKYLKGLIDGLPIPPFSKQQLQKRIDRPWMVDRGFTPPTLLSLNIKDEMGLQKESFDDYYEKLILEMDYDEDDFQTDLIEVLEKCTGPTKKASSDRKGKKWTKCAKQPDGSYKRIHWGQAGVRVSGKSNTKRRKSFRARHNCSNAKQGSSQQAACNDW